MSNRDIKTIDFGAQKRKSLVSEARQASGRDDPAELVDWALRMAIDHAECLADAREELRTVAREASGTHFNVDVETRVERDGRAR